MRLDYARYNRHRRPPFQVETTCWSDGGRRVARKAALHAEARAHLRRMAAFAPVIRQAVREARVGLPAMTERADGALEFAWVEGPTLAQRLAEAFFRRDAEAFVGGWRDYAGLLGHAFATTLEPLITEELRQVFGLTGPGDLAGLGALLTPALADLTVENIVVADGRYVLIDQEWVFEGCLPASLMLYRSLFYFYETYKPFDLESWMPRVDLGGRLGLAPAAAERCRAMDEAFQAYVFGRERCFRFKDRYVKYAHAVPSLIETIEKQRQVVRDYAAAIDAHKAALQQQQTRYQEVVQRQDAAIAQLGRVIAGMRASRSWRMAQAMARRADRLLPPGTRRRRLVDRLLHAVLRAARV